MKLDQRIELAKATAGIAQAAIDKLLAGEPLSECEANLAKAAGASLEASLAQIERQIQAERVGLETMRAVTA